VKGVRVVVWVFLAAGTSAGQPAGVGPGDLYQALNALRVDPHEIYYVRELHLRRDAVRISFSEGKLAFLAALNGRVTGAVFTGRGQVLAIPSDPAEKRSLARFLGAPLLDQGFSRAFLRFTDDTAGELHRQLLEAGAQTLDEPSFAQEWNPAVANLNPWHSLRVLADWLSAQAQPYFYAGLVGEVSKPFDVLVDNRREDQVMLGQVRWEAGVRYYDVWAAFPRADAPPAPSESFVPLAYAITTSILENRTLQGETLVRGKALHDGEQIIPLELSRFLTVQGVTDGEGRPLVFFQNEEINRRDIAQRGNDSLFVVLPDPAREGQEFRLQLTYRGGVISDAGNGVYFVGARGSWYPHIGGADHFVPFDLTFRWPRRLQLVATGKKLEEREENEWRVGHWKSEAPIPVAGFNLGEYASEALDASGLRIELYANRQLEQVLLNRFPRSPDPLAGLRPPSVWPHPARPQEPNVALPEPPPPSPAAVLKPLAQEIAEAIRFEEKFNGPFPFDQLVISQIPGSFGQGWPGLLYLSTLSFLPPEAQGRAGIGRRVQEQATELLPFHEVVHQWWGNVVGWASYHDQWIPEGLSQYLALLYADSKKPGERTLASWLERYRDALTAKKPGSQETPEDVGPLVLGYRLHSSKSPEAYDTVIYGKGSWVVHMLRMMLREPDTKNPDGRFIELLRSVLESHRYGALTTDDLQRATEKLMSPAMDLEGNHSMDWFFDQWVRGTGIPRYSVEFQARPQGTGFLVRGTLQQTGVPDTFIASVPLYAARPRSKAVLLGTVVTSGAETSFQFVSRLRPKRILIDPQLTLLCLTE